MSPRSTPFGANLIFGFRFRLHVPSLVVDRVLFAVTEHIRTTAGVVIQNADFPVKQTRLLSDSNLCLQRKNFSDIHVYNDEILLKSSL